MEKIQDLLKSLKELKEKFFWVQGMEIEIKGRTAEILQVIFENLQPILPFIYSRIKVSCYSQFNKRDQIEYYEQKGVCLSDNFQLHHTGSYPHVDNYGDYEGKQFWLLDNLTLIELSRSGSYSAWQQDSSGWRAIVTQISMKEMLDHISFESIIKGIIETFNTAIEENENKRQQLNSRLKTLKTIQSLLE